jgi:hypothetical protein
MESKKYQIELQPIQNPYETSSSSEKHTIITEIPQQPIDISNELAIEPSNTYLQECRAFLHHGTLAIVHLAKTFVICCSPSRLFNLCCQKVICEWRIRIVMILINIFGLIYVSEFLREYNSHEWQEPKCPLYFDFALMYAFLIINNVAGLIYNIVPFMIIHVFTTVLQFTSFIVYAGSFHVSDDLQFCTDKDLAFLTQNHEEVGIVFFIHYIPAVILACLNCWCLSDHYRSQGVFLYDNTWGTR